MTGYFMTTDGIDLCRVDSCRLSLCGHTVAFAHQFPGTGPRAPL